MFGLKATTRLLMALSVLGVAACGGSGKDEGSSSTARSAAQTSQMRPGTLAPGDHVSTYGHEANAHDMRQIAALVTRYYAAAAADDGAKACSMIYPLQAEAVAEDLGQPPGPPYLKGKTCQAVMKKLFRHLPGQSPAVMRSTRVLGARLIGGQGYVQITNKALPIGVVFVQRQGKTWKIDGLIGKSCTDCAPLAAVGSTSDGGLTARLERDVDDDENGEETGTHLDNDNDADVRADRQNEAGGYLDADDNQIARYGQPASGTLGQALQLQARRYFGAAALADGASACKLIDPAFSKTIASTYGRPPGPSYMRGSTCERVLESLFKHSASEFRDVTVLDARVSGGHAYVLVGSPKRPAGYLTLELRQGIWMVEGMTAMRLP